MKLGASLDGKMDLIDCDFVAARALRDKFVVNRSAGSVCWDRGWRQTERREVSEKCGRGRGRGRGWSNFCFSEPMVFEKQSQLSQKKKIKIKEVER